MREGIPARVSEIDPTRFWVWVSNSELVPMLRKSQLPPIPRIRSPHSPHSFALFPAYAHSFATAHAVETREACVPTQASKDSLQAAEYCQLLSAFSHRHPRTPDRIFTGKFHFDTPALPPCDGGPLGTPLAWTKSRDCCSTHLALLQLSHRTDEIMHRLLLLAVASCMSEAAALHGGLVTRRSAILALACSPAAPAIAAEPFPAVPCDEACMKARVARKQELLRNQSRKDKFDAKIVFGGDYQAGKREASSGGGKVPIVGEFLFPNQVGGINLQSGGGGSSQMFK